MASWRDGPSGRSRLSSTPAQQFSRLLSSQGCRVGLRPCRRYSIVPRKRADCLGLGWKAFGCMSARRRRSRLPKPRFLQASRSHGSAAKTIELKARREAPIRESPSEAQGERQASSYRWSPRERRGGGGGGSGADTFGGGGG